MLTPTRCFVIMPFSGKEGTPRNEDYWTDFFSSFVKPSIEELGYECQRSTANPRNIVTTIVSDLFNANLVLAVLTDLNPNVFYELGVRHALAHGTVMIMEDGQKIPFDLSHFGVIFYKREERAKFREELEQAIEVIKARGTADNPVREFLHSHDVTSVRIATEVDKSPLQTEGALSIAEREILIVGQNLYNLATDQMRDRVFAELLRKPLLHARILIADSRSRCQVDALNEVIDEVFGEHLTKAEAVFREWLTKWRKDHYIDRQRLEIRRCKRVGNVSATLVDKDSPSGAILVRPVLYHTHDTTRPCHWLSRSDSPRIYDSYKTTFKQIWTHGDPLA